MGFNGCSLGFNGGQWKANGAQWDSMGGQWGSMVVQRESTGYNGDSMRGNGVQCGLNGVNAGQWGFNEESMGVKRRRPAAASTKETRPSPTPPLWISLRVGVCKLGRQDIPPWKVISHRGRRFPTVGNHAPPLPPFCAIDLTICS